MLKTKKLIATALAAALTLSAIATGSFTRVTAVDAGTSTDVALIANDSVWKYQDQDVDLYAAKFYEKAYDDSTWKTGKQPLGYPTTDINPTFGELSTGTLLNSKAKPNAIITYYFRKDFTVDTLQNLTALKATVGIDDGFVLYINGTEVNRSYIDAGTVTHATITNLINEPSDPTGTVTLDLTSSKGLLTTGTNKIAVSVHNRDANSSDIYFAMNLIATYSGTVQTPPAENPEQADPNQTPKQVNAHMGDDPSQQINVTYTTITETDTNISYHIIGDSTVQQATGTHSQGAANKYFHAISLSGLTAGKQYEYTVGSGVNSYTGKFKTAPEKGSNKSFKFAYLADTQVSSATDAKALGATLEEISKGNFDFVYLAGDHTDTSTNETQWEQLFNNSGAFPNGGQDMYGNDTVAVVQGNHDNTTLQRHINAPAKEGNIVYSYDYGPATFIMINLETARVDATARDKQAEYVRRVAKEAKERGQWTVVGFHKSLYTGASHIVDSDVIEARKFWAPIISELDVDLVLQGHDHVYSRGFVNVNGQNAHPTIDTDGKVKDPKNSAMWMVGGHAGGLKWYSKINYTVGTGDPLTPGYSFLDVDSDDTGSDIKKEQVIVEIEVSDTEYTVNTYMFKYNTDTDTITTAKYLYDTVTVKRDVRYPATATTTGSGFAAIEKTDNQIGYTVALSGIDTQNNTNAVQFKMSYDPAVMTLKSVDSLLPNTVFKNVKDENGTITVVLGTSAKIETASANIAKLNFELKNGAVEGDSPVSLSAAATASAYQNQDGSMAAFEDNVTVDPAGNTVETNVYSYHTVSDINKDSKISLADLSIALTRFGTTNQDSDIDRSGTVDTADYIIIAGYLVA